MRGSVRRRLLAVGISVVSAASITGCAVVDVYSDSILADSSTWSYGEVARQHINEQSSQIGTNHWFAEPMRAMNGSILPHSYAKRALEGGAGAIVISFGTNDASNSASGVAGSYSADTAKWYAADWLNRAKAAGAACVVWVTPNPNSYSGRSWASSYKAWVNNFNGWLSSLGGTVSTGGGTIKLRLVSLGALAAAGNPPGILFKADGVHPNSSGAAFLGEQIKAQIKTCT